MCTFEVLVQNKRSSNPSWKIRFEIKSYAELNHNINNSFTGYLRQSGLWSLCFLFKLDATMKMPISYQNSGTIMENFINECYLATCNDHCQNWNKTHIRIQPSLPSAVMKMASCGKTNYKWNKDDDTQLM